MLFSDVHLYDIQLRSGEEMFASDDSICGYSQYICLKAEKAPVGACAVLDNRWVTIPIDLSKSILREIWECLCIEMQISQKQAL